MVPRLAGLVSLVLGGCAIDDRLFLEVPVRAGGTGQGELATADGGTITLTEATVTFGDLRLEEPPEADLARALRALSPIATAWAHPGHDYPGDVAGELLGAFTVDLLAPDAELGVAACYEGRYATGRVSVAGPVAALAGTWRAATGEERPFRFAVEAEQEIGGIGFEAEIRADQPPAAIVLRFDPAAALAHVDWSEPDTDGDGVLTTADGTHANTTTFGVLAAPTWSLAVAP